MATYFLRRFLLMIPTFIGVTFFVFMITRIVPGGPMERWINSARHGSGGGREGGGASGGRGSAGMPKGVSDEMIKQWQKQFHFDRAPPVAYCLWLKDVAQLNLGESINTQESVWDMVVQRFPVSLTFGLSGFILAYLVCIPLGIAKALRHGSAFDFVSSTLVFIGYSIPGWALGMLLLLFLASGRFYDVAPLGGIHSLEYSQLPRVVKWMSDEKEVKDEFGALKWENLPLPAKVLDRAYYMMLPVFCYTVGGFAMLTVLTKNSLMDNLGQDYVRTAFAKGLSPRRAIFLHAMRNSLIPLATGFGDALGLIMSGAYLIEFVFNINGLGFLGFRSIQERDYGVVMGILVINTVLLLFGRILSDFLYAVIDPRIRFE
ncbi:MAG: ABC transporter permease subunit [Planctomycetes bacterium]|nr:ABC transporter permease subunit [Planctomycetota bacterium]